MTRLERLAKRETERLQAVTAAQQALKATQSAKRVETTKARDKRRYQVGALAEAHGLCALDDATLAGLFAALARLLTLPQPGAFLHGLLDGSTVLGEGDNGMAHPMDGVSPLG